MTLTLSLRQSCRDGAYAVPRRRRRPSIHAESNGQGTNRAARRQRGTSRFFQGEQTGSANIPCFFGPIPCKSLIVESTATAACPRFAINHALFATSLLFMSSGITLLPSLSISLKKKRKESEEGRKIAETQRHELMQFRHQSPDLPIFCATSFRCVPRSNDGDQWQRKHIQIK